LFANLVHERISVAAQCAERCALLSVSTQALENVTAVSAETIDLRLRVCALCRHLGWAGGKVTKGLDALANGPRLGVEHPGGYCLDRQAGRPQIQLSPGNGDGLQLSRDPAKLSS
jgi:hypothetical protein